MPRIPTYIAQGGAGVLQIPRVLNAPEPVGDEALTQGLSKFGETASYISGVLTQQRAEAEYIKAATMYDAGIEVIKQDIFRDPAVKDHPSEFVKRAQALQEQVAQSLTLPASQNAMMGHVAKALPKDIVGVRAESLKLYGQAVTADLMANGEMLSTLAAQATDPRERDNAIQTQKESLDRALERGIIGPVKHQEMLSHFTEQTLTKNMDYLARTDRAKLYELDRAGEFSSVDPVKREKILEGARIRQEQEDARATKAFKTVQEAVIHEASGLANQGVLPQATLDEALQNRNPYITPEKARQLQEWNDNPVSASSAPVRVIMQEYHGGVPSLERVIDTRRKLNEYAATLDRPSKHLDAALNELQNDQRSAEASARAERGVRAAETQAGIAAAKDLYKEDQGVWLPGMLGQMFKAASAADQAAINTLIRNGIPPKEAVERVKKQRQERLKTMPDHTKGVLDLVK